MMTIRDLFGRWVPSWLADNATDDDPSTGSNGYRVLYTCVRFVDSAIAIMMQGSVAAVGRGTPTALPYVGDERGVVRGRFDTDDAYRAKLPTWLDRWREAGQGRRLVREVWEYLGNARVRLVTRSGHWITLETNGTMTETDAAWDWDSVSHPERNVPGAPWWSDEWLIIYPTYPVRPGTLGGMTGDDGLGLGHLCPRVEVDQVKLIVNRYKACHSCVRAVIWTSSSTRFDPATPTSKPNGTWGAWGILDGSNHYVPSGRDLTECRYWEPR